MLKKTDTTGPEPRLEGGSVRPDGTVRKVVKVKPGWVGDLDQVQYKTRGKHLAEERQRSGPVGGQVSGPVGGQTSTRGRGPVGGQVGGQPAGGRGQAGNSAAGRGRGRGQGPVGAQQAGGPAQVGGRGKARQEAALQDGQNKGLTPEEIQAKLIEKEITKIRQKLKEVSLLEGKIASGYEPDTAQKEKLQKKPDFEQTLKKLVDQRTEVKEKI